MKQTQTFVVWLAVLLVGFALAGCSSSVAAAPKPVQYTVEMSDFAFSPNELEFEVGQEVTLNLVNVGALDHELMIGKDIIYADGLPEAYGVDYFAGIVPIVELEEQEEHADEMDMHDEHEEEGEEQHHESAEADGEHQEESEEHEGHHGFMVELEPGQSASITFTVTESMLGEWEIGCLYGEGSFHYTSGMVGSVSVTN